MKKLASLIVSLIFCAVVTVPVVVAVHWLQPETFWQRTALLFAASVFVLALSALHGLVRAAHSRQLLNRLALPQSRANRRVCNPDRYRELRQDAVARGLLPRQRIN